MADNAFFPQFPAFNTDAFSKYFTTPDSFNAMARETIAAGNESTRLSMKGMQTAGATMLRQMKDQVALSVETGKKVSETSSLEDAMALQVSYLQSSLEAGMKGLTELSEQVTGTFREAVSPLMEQATKLSKTA